MKTFFKILFTSIVFILSGTVLLDLNINYTGSTLLMLGIFGFIVTPIIDDMAK
jgi:hypothetical protein